MKMVNNKNKKMIVLRNYQNKIKYYKNRYKK